MHNCMGKKRLIFETSWEVCNKIGGIYTVLSTKAKTLQELHKDNIVFVGPDVWSAENPSPYFKEYKTLLKNCVKKLDLPHGLSIRVGRWQIPGTPIVVLIKFDGIYEHLNSYYGEIWNNFKVDSLHAYGDYDEGCAFGISSAIVIAKLTEYLKADSDSVIAHFNEWTTAMGLLHLQTLNPHISTLFTTHATSIGRSICGNGKPLYDYLSGYNGDQMAEELNMQSKHSLEKSAAHNADCFTTVSDVTAIECRQLLDIMPQVVTPNGFEPNFVPKGDKYNNQRIIARKTLLDIAKNLTGKAYDDNTFIVATSGRNEYRNKGIDLFIDAIDSLGYKISGSRDVLAFILVPAWVKEPAKDLLKNMQEKSYDSVELNYQTHRLHNEECDAISCRLRTLGINNDSRKITLIYLPCYLDGKDGVLNISYYDLMPALDATVFPSYYEPWGYTPLESIAFGVPTISSDKAGFGQWILSNYTNDLEACGAKVVARTDSNYDQAKEEIADTLLSLLNKSSEIASDIRLKAQSTSLEADWKLFMTKYIDAFAVAERRRDERCREK